MEVQEKVSSGVVDGVTLSPRYRKHFQVSNNHQQPVIDGASGNLLTKLGKDVVPGDFLILPQTEVMNLGEETLPDGHALFLGMYFADGSLFKAETRGDYRLSIDEVNKDRHELAKEPTLKFFSDFSANVTFRDRPKYNHVSVYGKAATDHIISYGVGVGGKNKIVPEVVMKGSLADIRQFLRGASFDTHKVDNDGFVWTFETEEQAHCVAHLLSLFGVFADYRARKYTTKNSIGDHLYITGTDAVLFRDRIGFVEPKKIVKSLAFSRHTNARGKYDIVPPALARKWFEALPTAGKSTSNAYQAINQALFRGVAVGRQVLLSYFELVGHGGSLVANTLRTNRFVEVESIQPSQFSATDLQVEGELFVAQGIATHNSTMNTGFGAKNDTPGGRALKFFASLRMSVDRIEAYKERGEVAGAVTLLKTPKNKTHRPRLEMKFNLMYDMPAQKPGFDSAMSLVDCALANAIWIQEGSKYSLPSTSELVTGKATLRDALRDNKELRKITERATLESMNKTEDYIKRSLRG